MECVGIYFEILTVAKWEDNTQTNPRDLVVLTQPIINIPPNKFIIPERLDGDYEARDVGTQGICTPEELGFITRRFNFSSVISCNYMQIIPKQYLSSGCEM